MFFFFLQLLLLILILYRGEKAENREESFDGIQKWGYELLHDPCALLKIALILKNTAAF